MSVLPAFVRHAVLVLVTLALPGCERDGEVFVADFTIPTSAPDSFLLYFNPQVSQPAGYYTLVVGTETAGRSGSFTVTAEFDDGDTRTFNGSWTLSGGQSATDAGNPGFGLELVRAGGLKVEVSGATGVCLYLLRDPSNTAPDTAVRTGQQFAPRNASCVASLDLPASTITSAQYAQAYYRAVDPDNRRTSLAAWKTENGFDAGADAHVQFRDTRDLGYGRNMFYRANDNGTMAFFVDNFQVQTIPGQEYSDLNLEALLADARQHQIGSNSIEYSCADPVRANCDCNANPNDCYLKFFTFEPPDENGTQPRRLVADLDGRGEKSIPGICVSCHGGDTPPLLPDGTFPHNGNTNAKFQFLELRTEPESGETEATRVSFDFSADYDSSREHFEPDFKIMNLAVYCTYPGADAAACAASGITPPVAGPGDWQGDFLVGLVEDCYEADFSVDTFGGDDQVCDPVPAGWRPDSSDGNPPPGADDLFRQVIGPHCLVCHARRGSDLGTDNNASGDGEDIDLSSWDKFLSYADDIERLVYDEGRMPMGLLNYNKFWADPNKPALLGSFLPGFSHGKADGSVDLPGLPIASAGPSRTTTTPVKVSAEASRLVDDYRWSIVAVPTGANANLAGADSVRPTFSTDMDGEYELRLQVTNELGTDVDTLVLTIDSAMSPTPDELTFDTHIKPILQPTCTSGCHENGGVDGVPVWWTDAQQLAAQTLYSSVIARVNFADIEASLILTKPSGNHHYGDLVVPGFDVEDLNNRHHYDTLVNWIASGAREN